MRQVDYVDHETKKAHKLIRLLPTPKGTVSYISVATVERIRQLRAAGVFVVIVTAARLGTLVARSHGLPRADMYIIESGGRIVTLDAPTPGGPTRMLTSLPLREDMGWRSRFLSHAGMCFEDETPPEERTGAVWDCYRDVVAQLPGAKIDHGYATCFRVKGEDADRVAAMVRGMSAGKSYAGKLQLFYNLGCLDVVPVGSGKKCSAEYVMRELGAAPEDCTMCGDDENDLQLCAVVGRAFCPTVTHPAVREAARGRPGHFVLVQEQEDPELNPNKRVAGTMATDMMLKLLLQHFGI